MAAPRLRCALVLDGLGLPEPTFAEKAGGSPICVVLRKPRFITAVICGVVFYPIMNSLMMAALLEMRLCVLLQDAVNLGLKWHVLAM
ncbi:hypothetical protein E2C06_28505 [Dankookia rubra]|uniref:Uncharacterized protein n=1 Tax=Dankookia rubra TaxID=1442381 RepID=A0A4R5Q8E3_9PROT|nr:hypothetical protein [Dankookia rubra]TDH59220.1 hypothetical protein E2C06_28505 [Dankookia rubra]